VAGPLEAIEAASLEKLGSIQEGVAGIAEVIEQMPDFPVEMRRFVELMRRGSYSGPLPPPEILEGYKAAYPDAPAIIFNELVEQGSHRRAIERMAINRQEGRADRGQIFALIIVVLVLAACVYLGLHHQPWVAGTLFGATLASIVGTFVYGSRRQVLDLGSKRRRLGTGDGPEGESDQAPSEPDSN
jgi:uncharacterized membrane protein